MFKISFILLVSLSLSLAARPPLRSDIVFQPSKLINVITKELSFLFPTPETPFEFGESEELNQFAQALAEQNGNPISFIDSYTQSAEHVLSFGFKLRGNTTLETILLGDSTLVSDHMSGFLDFRYKEAKLNMIASEIRESLKIGRCFTPGNYELKKCAQHKSTGTVSVTGETFNFETKLNGLRDILSLMTLYDLYLQSQIKLMDSNGNIPLGFKPATLKMDFKNFVLNVETRKTHIVPLKVDAQTSKDDLLEEIDFHFRKLVDDSIVEALEIPKAMDKYGFGISIDSNDDITIVYTFGGKNRPGKSTKKVQDFFSWQFVTPSGKNIDFNVNAKLSNTDLQRRNNQLMIEAVNLDRLYDNLRPLRSLDPKLYELAQKEADRSAAAGKLIEPTFKGVNGKILVIASSILGKTTVKDFVFANEKSVGTIACFDNFTNSRTRVFNFFESYGNICNRKAVEIWNKFDGAGTGIGWNANGDVFSYVALSETL